jgi:Ca2+-binding RTX toxin-like protein
VGLGGDDTYYVYNAADRVFEAIGGGFDRVLASVSYTMTVWQEIEVLAAADAASTAAINLTGNWWAQTIFGNAGNNVLDTGNGVADVLVGLGGDDTYYVHNAGDWVAENAGQGFDRVLASVSYRLAAGQAIEILAAANTGGTDPINLYGNELGQTIYGNAGANVLDTGNGVADDLVGFGGNDTYYVYNAADRVFETIGGGFDRVLASVSYTMTVWHEIEMLAAADAASTAAINLTGNWWAQTIFGNAGNNVLDTGNGVADVLVGLGGDDTYYVHNAGDWVAENAGQGFDRVLTSVSYKLPAGQSIEILAAANTGGTAAINLTGNEFGQAIYGNAGVNDLVGLGGDDIYYVYNAADRVFEAIGGGFDRVLASVSYTMTVWQEIEVLAAADAASTAAINLTGNWWAQTIFGNAGNNVLDTGNGVADVLVGLGGDDTYYVHNAGDWVAENAGQGFDRVLASVSYKLPAGQSIEILAAANTGGTDPINLTGNELGQAIYGNAGANVLNGGGGVDWFFGGAGRDSFVFNTALGTNNIDEIVDFNRQEDTIHLENAIFFGLLEGPLAAQAFAANASGSATTADARIIYNTASGQLSFDADGSGGGAAVSFAVLNGAPSLSWDNFLVI